VELTQSLGTMRRENKTLTGHLESYEGQIRSWKTRHNALEARSRELQAEANQAGITAAKLTALESDMQKLQRSYDDSITNIKRLQDEEKTLRKSLHTTSLDLDHARQVGTTHESEKLSLRQQLADLQDQLELMKRSAPINGEHVNGNAGQPLASGLINLVSSKRPKRRSLGPERFDTSIDGYSGSYHPRPVSMAVTTNGHDKTLSGLTLSPGLGNIEFELESLLADEDGLNDEVTQGLIRQLKIPSPSNSPPPTEKEVLFPAYLITLSRPKCGTMVLLKNLSAFLPTLCNQYNKRSCITTATKQ